MMVLFISCSIKEIRLYLEVVQQLDDVLSPRLSCCNVKEKRAVRLFASLILYILHLVKRVREEDLEEASMRIQECKFKLHEFVKGWVVKSGVIGGSVFGGQISLQHPDNPPKYTENELKVILINNIMLC